MTNVNTQYWKRVIAYFDRVESGEEHLDYDELLQRAKRIARHGQAANDRVAELEAEVEQLRSLNRQLSDRIVQLNDEVRLLTKSNEALHGVFVYKVEDGTSD